MSARPLTGPEAALRERIITGRAWEAAAFVGFSVSMAVIAMIAATSFGVGDMYRCAPIVGFMLGGLAARLVRTRYVEPRRFGWLAAYWRFRIAEPGGSFELWRDGLRASGDRLVVDRDGFDWLAPKAEPDGSARRSAGISRSEAARGMIAA